jgi:hypothetical protein
MAGLDPAIHFRAFAMLDGAATLPLAAKGGHGD